MTQIQQVETPRPGRTGLTIGIVAAALLAVLVAVYAISGLDADQREMLREHAQDYLPIFMFLTLATLLFSGYPVAFVLGGVALSFGLFGYFIGTFKLIQFYAFVPRIWGQAAENLVLVAIPAFIFMGVMMERSGVARDLLYCVQVLLKRVPGALALGVTIMGTILAAMTGIIGASVTMMTALAHADDDQAGLQSRAGGRYDRRVRHARHPDSAQHHADHHGRPARRLGRSRCSWRQSCPV